MHKDIDAINSEIKAIAEIMKEYGLTSVKIKDESTEFSLEREFSAAVAAAPSVPSAAAASETAQPSEVKSGKTVKTPIVGVFYSSPSPEEKPYVQVGDAVKKGDVLCIVEAMKLMNEITAEQDGEIVEICVKDGDLVEYGQTLFVMK